MYNTCIAGCYLILYNIMHMYMHMFIAGVEMCLQGWWVCKCVHDGESLYINLLFLSPIYVYKFGSYDSSKSWLILYASQLQF